MTRSKNLAIPLLVVLLFLASCASKPTPPVEEPAPPAPTEPVVTPEPTPPETPAFDQAALDALHAETLALRKKAFDLGLAELMRDEYKTADAAYVAGKGAYDAKDGETATKELTTARDLFKDLIAKGLVELSAQGKQKASEMRGIAVKAGAETDAQDRFAAGEAAFAEAEGLAGNGRYEESIAAYARARSLYDLSYKRASASQLRTRIGDQGYAAWDSGNYGIAENKYAEEANLFAASGGKEPKDVSSGVDALEEAILRYNLVIEKGREGIASASKKKADDIKTRSEAIKANVAVKAEYAEALAVYQEAGRAFGAKDFELATTRFADAEALFEKAYALAAEKRKAAEEAMAAAENASEESQRKAQEAEPLVAAPAEPQP